MDFVKGALVGVGNTADVYDIGDSKVLKLYHAGYARGGAEWEAHNAALLDPLGLPAPRCYGLVEREGRSGIIYDKVVGTSLLDIALQTRDVDYCAGLLADLHKRILQKSLPAAADAKAILAGNLRDTKRLDGQRRARLLEALAALPEGDALCHGDFHFGNVLVDGQTAHIIDFMNICRGAALFDVARTVYLTEMTPPPAGLADENAMLALKTAAADAYLRKMGVRRNEIDDWLTVVAAARLHELRDEQAREIDSILRFLAARGY